MPPTIDFWCELASTYTYLSVMRIEPLAREAGVTVRWRPFTLGPIFAASGWNNSPFELYPAKGRYMWRDVEREAERLGVPWKKPSAFPRNSVLAARVAIVAVDRGFGPSFVKAAMAANFAHDLDIARPEVLAELLAGLGQDAAGVLEEAQSPARKPALRAATEEAVGLGIFGAPTFAAGGELFWGNDRLEQALAWARRPGQAS